MTINESHFDLTIFEIYDEYKKKNINFIPHVRKRIFSTSNSESKFPGEVYTLGGISNVGLIMTNENGYYPVSYHDQFGWSNVDVDYNEFDLALLGGSEVEGYSVKQENNIVSILKENKINAISLGFATNGPMTMYAVFIEYVKPFKPKNIIWFYTDDDIYEMQKNFDNKYLIKYLNDNTFSQNLIQRQEEIDKLMTEYALKRWKILRKTRSRKHNLFRILKLGETRHRLGLFTLKNDQDNSKIDSESKEDKGLNSYQEKLQKLKFLYEKELITKEEYDQKLVEDILYDKAITEETYASYDRILTKIIKQTSLWDATLYFVYLPSKLNFEVFETNDQKEKFEKNKNVVFEIIKNKNIKFLNLENKIKEEYDNPLDLYSQHLNKRGYEFATKRILDFLEK